jgi:gamma-butyrobetaine dioxygenase
MKIEVFNNNTIHYKDPESRIEIHPLWLRERIRDNKSIDINNEQRLYEHTKLDKNLSIKTAIIQNNLLNIEFSDGIKFNFEIEDLLYELNKKLISNGPVNRAILWDSTFSCDGSYVFNNDMFKQQKMYNILQDFYRYGFVIIKGVPIKENFILKFANSIGAVRATNFGEIFNVLSVPKPNDLAYTSLGLSAHTDNPYRKPVPCIQLLHCLKNKVSGGHSTLVDGFAVANYLKKNYNKYYNILTKTKVRFRFVDKDVILENWGELIQLDEKNNTKQIRYSSRLDYVPAMDKKKLEIYYEARRKIAELYSSKQFEIKFKLNEGDLLMMDNHRLLHGRTEYDANEGERHLQGCYIDYDSTEGKLRHLKRKLNIN